MKQNIFLLFFAIACSSTATTPTPTSQKIVPVLPEKALTKIQAPGAGLDNKFNARFEINPDGSRLVYFSELKNPSTKAILVSLPDNKPIPVEQPDNFLPAQAYFSKDGKYLFLLGDVPQQSLLLVIDPITGKEIQKQELSKERKYLTEQGRIACATENTLTIIEPISQERIQKNTIKRRYSFVLKNDFLLPLTFFVWKFEPSEVRTELQEIFDANTGELLFSVGPFPDDLRYFEISIDHQTLLLVQGADTSPILQRIPDPSWTKKHVSLWSKGENQKLLDRADWELADLHPSGKQLVVLSIDREVFVWDVASSQKRFSLPTKDTTMLDYAAKGTVIITQNDEGMIGLWNAQTGERIGEIVANQFALENDEFILTQDKENQYNVWSTQTGALLLDTKKDPLKFAGGFFLSLHGEEVSIWKVSH